MLSLLLETEEVNKNEFRLLFLLPQLIYWQPLHKICIN